MSFKIGLVGLPNSGKSTLFSSLTKMNVDIANYEFTTINPNISTLAVEDERIDFLSKFFNSKKKIYTTIKLFDIAGLIKGASKGQGLGNLFLSHIKEVQLIAHVVRCFKHKEDEKLNIPWNIEVINFELIYKDLENVSSLIKKLHKKAINTKDEKLLKEYNFYKKLKAHLEKYHFINTLEFDQIEKDILKLNNFLTAKPMIYVLNVDDNQLLNYKEDEKFKNLISLLSKNNKVVVTNSKILLELSTLNKEEQNLFCSDFGIDANLKTNLIKTFYDSLSLKTYFTAGPEETRAWTFHDKMFIDDCAGLIHTDFKKNLIKAEVYSYYDLKKHNSLSILKNNGLIHLKGKSSKLVDGDVCFFKVKK